VGCWTSSLIAVSEVACLARCRRHRVALVECFLYVLAKVRVHGQGAGLQFSG
jgi:hypothetical protein